MVKNITITQNYENFQKHKKYWKYWSGVGRLGKTPSLPDLPIFDHPYNGGPDRLPLLLSFFITRDFYSRCKAHTQSNW